MNLAQNLTAARLKCNLTQKEAADHLGVQRLQVIRWEKGQQEMGVNKFREICKLYEISADELLNLSTQN